LALPRRKHQLFGVCGVGCAEVLDEAPMFHLREKRGGFTTVFLKLGFCVSLKLYGESQASLNGTSVLGGILGETWEGNSKPLPYI